MTATGLFDAAVMLAMLSLAALLVVAMLPERQR